jgi:hypothetical protein
MYYEAHELSMKVYDLNHAILSFHETGEKGGEKALEAEKNSHKVN